MTEEDYAIELLQEEKERGFEWDLRHMSDNEVIEMIEKHRLWRDSYKGGNVCKCPECGATVYIDLERWTCTCGAVWDKRDLKGLER